MLLSFKSKRLEISLLLRKKFKWTICLSSTTKRSQVKRYGPCLTLLNQPKAHFFQESSRMKRLAPSPTPGYWDCVLREQTSAGSRSWDKGEAGDGNPDAEIRGVPGLQFFVFCFVLFCFFKPFAPQFGHGLLVWSRNKGGGGGPPAPLLLIRHCKQLTLLRRSEIMFKLDPASCHHSMMNTS